MEIRETIEAVAARAWPGSRLQWTKGHSRFCVHGTLVARDSERLIVFDHAGETVAVIDGETLQEVLPRIIELWRRKLTEKHERRRRVRRFGQPALV